MVVLFLFSPRTPAHLSAMIISPEAGRERYRTGQEKTETDADRSDAGRKNKRFLFPAVFNSAEDDVHTDRNKKRVTSLKRMKYYYP